MKSTRKSFLLIQMIDLREARRKSIRKQWGYIVAVNDV